MRPIQMVDTKSQYLKIKPEIDAAIHAVLDSTAYINGKPVHEFTASLATYIGSKYVIPLRQWNRCFTDCYDGT